jgi:hypothetical protein
MYPVPTDDPKRYRSKRCLWCTGSGVVDRVTAAMHARWLIIREKNRVRCTLDAAAKEAHSTAP